MQFGEQGDKHILGYHSSTLDDTQKGYGTTELECWAAVSSLRKFNVYVKGAPSIKLISDHEPLQRLRNQKDPRGKFARWILELEQYEYSFEHRPGIEIAGPDALSRIQTSKEETDLAEGEFFEDHIYVLNVLDVNGPDEWKSLLKKEQDKDPAIVPAYNQLTKKRT